MTTRRAFIIGMGSSLLQLPVAGAQARAPGPVALNLRLQPAGLTLKAGLAETPVWALQLSEHVKLPACRAGDQLDVRIRNDLPIPAALSFRGVDGNSAAEPLTVRSPISPGAEDAFSLTVRTAGTVLCEALLVGGDASQACALALVVDEAEPIAVDQDNLFLIENWLLGPDGRLHEKHEATTELVYTANGQLSTDVDMRVNDRSRFRFINSTQSNVIALKIENHEVRVMAIDGVPSEPFLARDSQIVLAPGTRIDAIVDATGEPGSSAAIVLHDGRKQHTIGRLLTSAGTARRDSRLPPPSPLPSNRLPQKLDLKNALRVDLVVDAASAPAAKWTPLSQFVATRPPAFHVKRDRTVVIALTNRSGTPATFHLHGHHFRLLDRLDDGWKPFWLDTLALDAGQTQRIAFLAEFAGTWLMEAVNIGEPAPRRLSTYVVQ